MKKSLILSLIVAAAADAAPIYDAYTDNLPPRRPEPYYSVEYEDVVSNTPFGIEISATYSNMLTSIHEDYDMQHVGADLTGIYNFTENWAVTLRFSWNTGSDSIYDEGRWKATVYNYAITPGIRYSASLGYGFSCFVGGNLGLGYTDGSEIIPDYYGDGRSIKANIKGEYGFNYAAEIGLRYDINESCYVFGAVQYWGTTAAPELGDKQKGLGARVGMGFGF